jgi:hypothetical protein
MVRARWLATAVMVCGMLCGRPLPLRAQTVASRPEMQIEATGTPPVIDGRLDDQAWQRPALPTGEWLSYNPLHGNTIPQQTTVWLTYDRDNIYIAFKCDDPEPDKVKTSVSRRDNIWSDDWVGVSLDALGTGQQSYHMLVNPSGVQLDMLNSVAGDEDQSVDWVWDSAGHRTETGYVVEIRLPLRSIRFSGGRNVRMGLLFWRRVSRLGVSVAWPPLEPGKWVFERNASAMFADIQPRLPRDIIPSLAVSQRQDRDTPSHWSRSDDATDVGFSAKLGVAPAVTLDVTVNPDFSQVESDAFQVEVNQRFPVFYSEKRPFFMEGAGIFNIAGAGGDNSLRSAVHTRRIVDPVAGAKLTGSVGRVTFGTLTALDQAPGRAVAPDDRDAGKNRVFNVARAQYSLGPSNYVGALVTDTEFAGGHNRVVGTDLSWRVTGTQRLSGFLLSSNTSPPHDDHSRQAVGTELTYAYNTRAVSASGAVEHYGRDFQMDTAFINRVGMTSAWAFVERSFYPDKAGYGWLLRVTPFSFSQGGHDELAGGNDSLEVAGVRFSFTRQGFLRVDRSWGSFGNVQLYRWLRLEGRYVFGRAVFYDPISPFAGRSRDAEASLTFQPSGRFSQELSYERVIFDRASTRVYTLDIINGKTIYQFTRQLFVRGIAQYDSSRNRVLTDFLLSYEPNPGTVAYVGYGSLLERRDFIDGAWKLGQGSYRTSQRGLLLKLAYLVRF